MTAFGWLLIGALLDLGHWAATALPYIGGTCAVLVVIALPAIAAHAALQAIRREEQIEQIAGGVLDDTAPLTAIDQTNGSSE